MRTLKHETISEYFVAIIVQRNILTLINVVQISSSKYFYSMTFLEMKIHVLQLPGIK